MVKSLLKTVINTVWVILVCLEISQVISPSQAFGYALIAVYIGVLIIFRPMHSLHSAIYKPDVNIPLERQAPNKVYSIILLSIKIILLIACVGITISGAILYRFFFLQSLAVKIHFLCTYWAFLASSVQLGVTVTVAIIPKLNNKVQKGCYYTAYLGVLVGILLSIQSKFVSVLFSLNEELISISLIQGILLLIGFVSVGISVGHILLKSVAK